MSYYGKGSGTDITITDLKTETTYYWKVIAYNGSGGHKTGPKWHFTTKASSTPTAPNLTITNTTYFGTTSLTQGQSASFTTKIKNNGSSSWSGRLYLKPVGTTDNWVKTNSVITIGSGSTYTFSGSYTPTDAGTYSLGIYYFTDGGGSGLIQGSNNPFTVTVAAAPTPSSTSLTIVRNDYFQTTPLTVGTSVKFLTQIKNTGSTEWTGDFYIKPVGTHGEDDWIPVENVTIKGGNIYTIYKDYTPTKAGTYSIGIYYRTRGESSGDLVNKGSYQNPFSVTVVNSANSETEWADLKMNYLTGNAYGFPSNQLTVGQTYQYRVALKNNGDTDWKGTLYLKDENDEEIYHWPITASSPLGGHDGTKLECYYTPTVAGNKTFSLKYQTDTHGKGRLVQSGTLSNPQQITVVEPACAYSGLKLNSAISYPSTLALGGSGNLSATVKNAGNSTWTGILYLADNGTYIKKANISLSKGGEYTLAKSGWTPSSAGKHEISVVFKAKTTDDDALVNDGGFANPVTVTVTNNTIATRAKLTLVTKGLAPTCVSPGTEVYYHFRVTDENGNRLSGVKALFDYKLNSDLISNNYASPASDANGLITLCLKTEGDDAIAQKGQTAKLTCRGLTTENGTALDLYESNVDGYITLSVKNGKAFDNVESMKIQIDPGVKWEKELKDGATGELFDMSFNLEASFPISLKIDYDENGNEERYTEAIGAKLEGGAKMDIGFNDNLNNANGWLSALKGGSSVSAGGDFEFSSGDFAGGLKCLAFAIAERMTATYSPAVNKMVQVLRNYYNNKFKPSTEVSGFIAVSANISGTLFDQDKLPVPKGILKPLAQLPYLGISELGVGASGSFKYVPRKRKTELDTGKTTYSQSATLKCSGNANIKETFINTFFKDKSWWQRVSPIPFFNKHYMPFFNFDEGIANTTINSKNSVISGSLGLGFKETEKYSDVNKKQLTSISNELSLSKTKKISLKNFSLIPGWDLKAFEAAYTTTATTKMTSGGTWLNYIHGKSTGNSETSDIINNAYPALKAQSLMSAPSLMYSLWNKDHLKKLSEISGLDGSQYNIKDVMKVEETNSSEVSMDVEIPFGGWLGVKFALGASVELSCYPSESYLSIEDHEYLPVVLRPSDNIVDVVKKKISDLSIDEALKTDQKELTAEWDRISAKYETGSVVGMPTYLTNATSTLLYGKPAHKSLYNADGDMSYWVKEHHPQLAKAQQKDICIFGFTINGETQNFNAGINLGFGHYYPAGELLACTNQGDTLFVVSEVCDLSAMQGEEALTASQNGKFQMETSVGVDDLTPFGFPRDMALDVYHADPGSDIWEYVGPAGQTTMVDKMGSYIMATPIANDIQAPELDARIYDDAGCMRLVITENIGLRLNTLQIYVNGSARTPIAIDEWNYIIPLTADDQNTMITFYASIRDLAGNEGHVLRLFHMEKDEVDPDGIEQIEASEPSSATIAVNHRDIIVSDCKPSVHAAVFTVSGQVMAEGKTDASGRLVLSLPDSNSGIYLVALSNGTTKKIYLK